MNNIVQADSVSLENLAQRLLQGQIIALPSETVYGLAADAMSDAAVAKIYAIKNRPSHNPLIVHVCDRAMVKDYCETDKVTDYLMQYFWPGALTIILPLKANHGIANSVTAGLSTIAVRSPKGLFRQIIEKCNKPLAAPSANKSGGISPTSATAVGKSLGAGVDLIVDGGMCEIGVESTIVKLDNNVLRILRPGGVTGEELTTALNLFNAANNSRPIELGFVARDAKIEAPGMLTSHYAPSSAMRLSVSEVKHGEVLLAFGQQACDNIAQAVKILNLSTKGILKEAAMNLYDYLRYLDGYNAKAIAVQPIPAYGLGVAINDRLTRAAAPRC